jgi:hypothetical protein
MNKGKKKNEGKQEKYLSGEQSEQMNAPFIFRGLNAARQAARENLSARLINGYFTRNDLAINA